MMKTIKKEYTAPCTIVCKMQMEGVMASASPTSLSENTDVVHSSASQGDTETSLVGGTEQHSGGDDLDAAKKNNLFYDEE